MRKILCICSVFALLYCGNATNLLNAENNVLNDENLQQAFHNYPNLKISVDSVSSTIQKGEPIVSQVTVFNTESSEVNQGFYVSCYLISNNGSSLRLNRTYMNPLYSSASYSTSIEYAIPSATLNDSYYIVFSVDSENSILENNESDNESDLFSVLVVDRPLLTDLTVDIRQIDLASETVVVRIYNQGAASLNKELVELSLYLSKNNKDLDSGDTTLLIANNADGVAQYQKINSGFYLEKTLHLPGLKQSSLGIFYLIATIDEPNNIIPESNESNNSDFALSQVFGL